MVDCRFLSESVDFKVNRDCYYLFKNRQKQKEYSLEHLLHFWYNLVLKQDERCLQQQPLAPTCKAKRSANQPFNYLIVLKTMWFMILVLCENSSLGHVSSMKITFIKLLENNVMSGFSSAKTVWSGEQ